MNRIAVVGTGYVGLVTGTCFAETGNQVVCVDIDEKKVEWMRNGKVPIYEPHLDVLFERNIRANRLNFTTSLEDGIKDAEIIFLALPTPPDEDGSADLRYVLGVANQLGKLLQHYTVIVDKSTVPVGTAELVHAAINQHAMVPFDVVSNPEFLREGFAVDDFLKPERVVIGASSARARRVMEQLYKPFVRQGNPIIFMDEKSAELTKYAANAFLATKITFMNEMANFCEKVGADVDNVRIGIGSDSRIGKRFLFPGIGYGGSCFPKDVQALVRTGEENDFRFQILDAVIQVNNEQKKVLLPKIKNYFKGKLKGKSITVWGLSFKPDTDDIREAPSLEIIKWLLEHEVKVTVFDPEAMENVRQIFSDDIRYAEDEYQALSAADALVICTEWGIFRNPNLQKMHELMSDAVVFDGRNLFDPQEMNDNGFYYASVGRTTTHPG
jgi:UDPglucose 6-dehydrogenase